MKILSPLQIHYLLSFALLSLYGTQVCPFIDSLSILEITAPLFITFGCIYGLRICLQCRLESIDSSKRAKTQFKADLTLFVAGGLSVAIFNFLVYSFPVASGLKLIFGMLVLGIFVACDLGLRCEHYLAMKMSETGEHIEIDQAPYPLTKKFSLFAMVCLVVFGAVICMLVAKDLSWISKLNGSEEIKSAALSVSLEVAFVVFVMLAYCLTIISSYGTNMQLFFDFQRGALNQVSNGHFSVQVPVVSNDEFGIIAKHTNHTIENLRSQTLELNKMRDASILALASLAETRDNETGAHVLRTQKYVKVLAEHLKTHPRFKSILTTSMIDLIYKSAPLHDSGKVGIPDAILLKPGRLTEDEFEIMKKHSLIGSEALQSAQEVLGSNSFLTVACEIMETHHEKWDGSGYPHGLKGEAIPVSGRLMALADVYDALTSERVYKAAFSHEKAREIIVDNKGSHFDPDIVDAFLEIETQFLNIAAFHSQPKADAGLVSSSAA